MRLTSSSLRNRLSARSVTLMLTQPCLQLVQSPWTPRTSIFHPPLTALSRLTTLYRFMINLSSIPRLMTNRLTGPCLESDGNVPPSATRFGASSLPLLLFPLYIPRHQRIYAHALVLHLPIIKHAHTSRVLSADTLVSGCSSLTMNSAHDALGTRTSYNSLAHGGG